MFRKMRRIKQLMPEAETISVFNRTSCGTLAVMGDDGYPYAVPLSFVYQEKKLYFHCAPQGHKLDAIRANGKASFCVVDKDEIVPEKTTSFFRSAIAFGNAAVVTDEAEKRRALELLAEKYFPGYDELNRKEVESSLDRVCILCLTIEHMTGKAARELLAPPEA